jgi:hypothetical protein
LCEELAGLGFALVDVGEGLRVATQHIDGVEEGVDEAVGAVEVATLDA